MIKISRLNKYYNRSRSNEIHVLRDVDLLLPERGMIAVFGRSGCGKTTLLNVIGGLDSFSSGSITIDGRDVREDTDRTRNEYIGYIFQNYELQSGRSCFDNVADALRLCGITDEELIEARTMAALANVGMEKYHARTPDTLSGGQQQRIAIARAIVKNPRIILADEPTGNLDESNTVMIMDLLKAISRDHLVILVTHEANLVDFYCDSVIELSDGSVVETRENSDANGFFGRNKNHVYLGELERRTVSSADAEIEYYGDPPSEPLKIRIVSVGGKLYLCSDSKKLQFLDESSEVRLIDGTFEGARSAAVGNSIDMSHLPPIHGSRFGRLFGLGESIVDGYRSIFKRKKRGRKLLISCMCLFSAVMVFATSIFGTAIGDRKLIDGAYNSRTFYVDTPDSVTAAILRDAVGRADTGIEYIRQAGAGVGADEYVSFYTGFFETFASEYYNTLFASNAVFLDRELARDLPLVAGSKSGLANEDILISSAVAERLIESSALGYITETSDLIGLYASYSNYSVDGKALRIAGVVEHGERVVYASSVAIAESALRNASLYVGRDSFGFEPSEGEVALMIYNRLPNIHYPSVGGKISIRGAEFTVGEVIEYYDTYDKWLIGKGIKKQYPYERFDEYGEYLCEVEGMATSSREYALKMAEYRNLHYMEFIVDYYSELDKYMKESYLFHPENINLWLYCEKGLKESAYEMLGWYDANGYYLESQVNPVYVSVKFYEENGRYPTQEEYYTLESALAVSVREIFDRAVEEYADEYDAYIKSIDTNRPYTHRYFVSDPDYVKISNSYGATHASATMSQSELYGSGGAWRTVVYSNDPALTSEWLERTLPKTPVVSPFDIRDQLTEHNAQEIAANTSFMITLLVLLCVCMYFIMRSSLMNRVKEVGILRAIGVSRRNLIFRFAVEATVLTSLTVLIGYLVSSLLVGGWLAESALVGSLFYYPTWLALSLLVIMYAVCIGSGLIPVLLLLRHTPSAILAKYDI